MTPYEVKRSVLDSLIRSNLGAEEAYDACEHLVGIDYTKCDQEALATLRHHQRSSFLKTSLLNSQSTKRLSSPIVPASKRPATEDRAADSADGIRFRHDDIREFYVNMRSSTKFVLQNSSACDHDSSANSVWIDVKKKSSKLTKEERERDRSVKKDNILKSLASQHLTEKEILRDVGDSRYTREVLRKLLAEAKIYRVGKGYDVDLFCGSNIITKCEPNVLTRGVFRGAGDPFRYVAAEFYDGADKLPEVDARHQRTMQLTRCRVS